MLDDFQNVLSVSLSIGEVLEKALDVGREKAFFADRFEVFKILYLLRHERGRQKREQGKGVKFLHA